MYLNCVWLFRKEMKEVSVVARNLFLSIRVLTEKLSFRWLFIK